MTKSLPHGDEPFSENQGSVTPAEAGAPTGRYVVVLSDEVHGDEAESANALRAVAGATSVASTRDFEAGALDVAQAESADATIFSELGMGVVSAEPGQVASLIAAGNQDSRVLAVEPEQTMRALVHPGIVDAEYLQGYRDAAEHLYEHVLGNGGSTTTMVADQAASPFVDTPELTWGLQATGAAMSSATGSGVKLAVLDTGFELQHPDFTARGINGRSFVPGQTVPDGNGHGTHCIGTSCGPAHPATSRRYGIASEADIFVGKVLSDQGSGTDLNILAGINWAVASGCQVISMSLGADIPAVSQRYEVAGRRALAKRCLIVAAAGNNAHRPDGDPGFVGVPANSPSIMAVAAVDNQLGIGFFSARSNPVAGGQVDIAAPGVAVYSSWRMPQRYNTISGTSMATPHVAGIAALWAETSGATGGELWALLTRQARRLTLPAIDAGSGLVQAP